MHNFRKNRISSTWLWCLLFILCLSGLTFAQQSTTGPEPPPGLDRGMAIDKNSPVIISGVPAYLWHHGCGPTAVGMVIGYWDSHGYDALVPGDASTQTAAANDMMACDDGFGTCGLPQSNHFQDYACPKDYSPSPLEPDLSESGGAHTDDCVADYMYTSQSARNNYYGWSWFSHVPRSFTLYVDQINPDYAPVAQNIYFSQFSWEDYKVEIDNNCPVVFLVDTNGDGSTDHFVTGIGYDDATNQYCVHDTWNTSQHWYTWRQIAIGASWGIYGVTTFHFENFTCGDANGDDVINIGDAIHVINYVFKGGSAPDPLAAGDANCDDSINIGDAVYIVNYVFKSGPAPCCP